jgi:hypothetical protein
MTPLKTGDPVMVTFEHETVEGFVRLASGNGRSLVLAFDAILGGYLGMMAVSVDDDGKATDLLTGRPVTITPTRAFTIGGDS